MKAKKIEVKEGREVLAAAIPFTAHEVFMGDVQIGLYTVTKLQGDRSVPINDSFVGLDAPKKHIPAVYEHTFISWLSYVPTLYDAGSWANIERTIAKSFDSLLVFFE